MPKITILESSGDIVVPAGARIYYQGTWTEKAIPRDAVEVAIDFASADGDPLSFQDHVLPEELVKQVMEQGVVTKLNIEYPDSVKYGAPLAVAVEKCARALVGSLGMTVSPDELQVVSKDRKDDGAETYAMTVWVSPALHAALLSLS